MLRIGWQPPEVPDFDEEIHNPEKVFALLCYRGIHYAKWVYLDVVFHKETSSEAGDNQEDCWDKHCQQKVDNWSFQGYFNNNCFHVGDD